MSMQSLHSIHYEGDQFLLVESKPGLGFHPEQFGIVTEKVHTACLRGFVCNFAIRDGGLFLDSLEVLATDGRYPEINGLPPACRGSPLRPALYFGLGRAPYTGTLRFGNDRDRTFHVDLFGPSIWMFRRVHEARSSQNEREKGAFPNRNRTDNSLNPSHGHINRYISTRQTHVGTDSQQHEPADSCSRLPTGF